MQPIKVLLLFFLTNSMMSQNYVLDSENSKVNFVIKNLGLAVNGSFSGLKGNITFDPKNLKSFEITASVNSNSVNTDNKARDKHLRKADYFDVEKYPEITFKSTKIEVAKRINRYDVEGTITIKGISKPIKLEMLLTENGTKLELKCNFEINRRNFKIGDSSMILSDTAKMSLLLIANQEAKK